MSTHTLYTPIPGDSDSIRLFYLEPGNSNESLTGSLKLARLSTNPSYEALSYTWGHHYPVADGQTIEEPIRHLRCDGVDLEIRENLYQALLVLRSNEIVKTLWIDAICINQFDDGEKVNQIKLMGNIFPTAKLVHLWLGPSDNDSVRAIELLNEFAESGITQGDDFREATKKHIKFCDPNFLGRRGVRIPVASDWKALLKFFSRQWFSRVWTFQEVILARQSLARCGHTTFNIEIATHMASFLSRSGWKSRLHSIGTNLKAGLDNIPSASSVMIRTHEMRLEGILHWDRPSKALKLCPYGLCRQCWAFSLVRLMVWITYRQCSESKDRVLATLTIATPLASSAVKTEIEHLMTYQYSVADLYTQFTHSVIKNARSLDILYLCDSRRLRIITGLPSWVPDFHQRTYAFYNPVSKCDATQFLGELNAPKILEGTYLQLPGIRYGYIYDMAGHFDPGSNVESWCRLAVSLSPNVCIPGRSRLTILARCLTAYGSHGTLFEEDYEISDEHCIAFLKYAASYDLLHACHNGIDIDTFWDTQVMFKQFWRAHCFQSFWDLRREVHELAYFFSKPIIESTLALGLDTEHAFQFKELLRLSDEFQKYFDYAGQRLVLTSEGSIGLAPEGSRCGDEICFLQGGRHPFILRNYNGPYFEVVGQAYLHGFMQGEIEAFNPTVEMITLA